MFPSAPSFVTRSQKKLRKKSNCCGPDFHILAVHPTSFLLLAPSFTRLQPCWLSYSSSNRIEPGPKPAAGPFHLMFHRLEGSSPTHSQGSPRCHSNLCSNVTHRRDLPRLRSSVFLPGACHKLASLFNEFRNLFCSLLCPLHLE